ncbi:MAG: hypothetical protein K1X86_12105 [Ignavibacteria bacterium]|nr:hypothetical protein [Ignavibacteria bacterium]
MKNLKVILSLLPVLALSCFIYFSTIGFSSQTTSSESKNMNIQNEKASGTVLLWINLISANERCITGYYEICLNGIPLTPETTEGFYLSVPCEEEFTLCIKAGSCYGTYTGTANCNTDTFRNIYLDDTNPHCDCF